MPSSGPPCIVPDFGSSDFSVVFKSNVPKLVRMNTLYSTKPLGSTNGLPLASLSETNTVTGVTPSIDPWLLDTSIVLLLRSG